MKIIIALLIALLIFLGLKTIGLLVKRLSHRHAGLDFLINLMVAVEFMVWLFFIFWAIDYLFREKFYYPYLVGALILIVIGFLGWFLLRDIFAGIIFRVKYNLKTGAHIRAGDISGNIKSLYLTCLKIRTDDGQLLRVPYSRINHELITELLHPDTLEENILRLQVDSSLSKPQAETLIRTTVMNTPWSNLKEEPTIKFLQENEKGYVVEVILFSLSAKHINYIETVLNKVPSLQVIS